MKVFHLELKTTHRIQWYHHIHQVLNTTTNPATVVNKCNNLPQAWIKTKTYHHHFSIAKLPKVHFYKASFKTKTTKVVEVIFLHPDKRMDNFKGSKRKTYHMGIIKNQIILNVTQLKVLFNNRLVKLIIHKKIKKKQRWCVLYHYFHINVTHRLKI